MGSSVKKYGKADAERLINEINSWIISCDNKAAILLAFMGVFIGVSSNIYKILRIISDMLWGKEVKLIQSIILCILMGLYFFSMILSFGGLLNVLYARSSIMIKYKKKEKLNLESPLYYGAIAKMGRAKFVNIVNNMEEDKLLEELNEQCLVLSQIAIKKYNSLNFSVCFVGIFSFLSVVMLSILNFLK